MGEDLVTDSKKDQRVFGMRTKTFSASVIAILLAVFALVYQFSQKTEETPTLKRFEFTQVHMAMPVTLTVWAEDSDHAKDACKATFRRIADLTRVFSDYDRRSETTRVNRLKTGQSTLVSQEFGLLLQLCNSIHEKTNGYFDPTAGKVIDLWRKARRNQQLPNQLEIDEALKRSGFETLKWSSIKIGRVELKKILESDPSYANSSLLVPESDGRAGESTEVSLFRITRVGDSRLDFGAVAKGFIGDEAIAVLEKHSIAFACYEAGGDIVCSAAPPSSEGWSVDVPGRDSLLRVSHCGVAVSGDSEQSLTIDDTTYSHVIDMKTGWGVSSRRTVAIKARRGAISDALATTGCSVSPDEFRTILRRFQEVELLTN